MLIIYIDSDQQMQEKVAEIFRHAHSVVTFNELFEAYKWIKRNHIPDIIVTEIDIENSMGLQALKFLQSKSKLKNTYKVGYTQHFNSDYRNLILSEGASEMFDKRALINDLSNFLSFISSKTLTNKLRGAGSDKNILSKKVSDTSRPKAARHKK